LDLGLVSCVCVTRGRTAHLRRAVSCFLAQSYTNRELVVVYEELEDAARALLDSVGDRATLVHVPLDPKRPLGELRNRGLFASHGAFVGSWDDDDWHSPRRLELQLKKLVDTNTDACLMTRWLLLDEVSGRAAVSAHRAWEGSLICRRDLPALVAGYPPLARGEDSVLVRRVVGEHAVSYLDVPELYVYTVHGRNTWPPGHFDDIFRAGVELFEHDRSRLRDVLAAARDDA
jgi:glycosyltransferase involved in cell wall biosynthesis